MKRNGIKWIPVILFLGLALFLWRGLSLDPHHLPSAQIGKTLPKFHLPLLEHPDEFLSSNRFHNKVTLLNVWASWCEACAEEQVLLMDLAREGVSIYGINYKDNSDNAKAWLKKWGNPYQEVAIDSEGRVAIDLGVYGTPETFVIDKKGTIRYRHAGVLNFDEWKHTIQPLMKELEQSS